MTGKLAAMSIQSHEYEASRLISFARTAYGVTFGLAFALAVWGYDGFMLASSAAEQPWAKFMFGLPLAIIIGFCSRTADEQIYLNGRLHRGVDDG